MDAGGSKLGCGLGSSGPRILGLRFRFALGLADAFTALDLLSLFVGVALEIGVAEGVTLVGVESRPGFEGVRGILVGGGDVAFVRAFLVFLRYLIFSSSSDVTSESLALKSMLMATDSMLPLELALKEGARFKGRAKASETLNVSARLIRRILCSTDESEN